MAASYYCYQCKILDGCLFLNHNKTIESLEEDLNEIWYRNIVNNLTLIWNSRMLLFILRICSISVEETSTRLK